MASFKIFAFSASVLIILAVLSWLPPLYVFIRSRAAGNIRWQSVSGLILQAYLAFALTGLLLQSWVSIVVLFAPPVGVLFLQTALETANDTGLWFAFWPLFLSGAILSAIFIQYLPPAVRRYILTCSIVSGIGTGLLSANFSSQSRMLAAANRLHASCLATKPLWKSISIWFEAPYAEPHAIAIIDDQWFSWSYRQNTFFRSDPEIPVRDPQTDCHLTGFTPRDLSLS